ncbi:MAG: hypothetical protein A2W31_12300 [Planctomycetes bacterium RBG_16_64_10]|nr:MAG: hypothetical protein A2W31_12300 [Planctomycetes bacterium RBG_16_64_10]
MRPLTAVIVVLAVAGPWFVLVGLRTEGAWLERFFLEQNLKRALATFDHHRGSVFYYIPAILIGFFPWSVLLGPTLLHTARQVAQRDPRQAGYLLLCCWLGVYVVFWSLIRTKLPHYVLPAYPALALLTGALVRRWLEAPESVARGWMLNATLTWIVVGIALLAAVPVVASFFLPGEGALGLVGLVLVGGGLWCLRVARRGQIRRMVYGFAVTSVAFVLAIFGFAAQRVDRHQNAPALLAEIRRLGPGPVELAAYRFFRESFVFYTGRPVPRCDGPAALQAFLAQAERPFVLTTDEYEREIHAELPGQLRVVARHRRFLQRGELVVLMARDRPARPAPTSLPNLGVAPGPRSANRTL